LFQGQTDRETDWQTERDRKTERETDLQIKMITHASVLHNIKGETQRRMRVSGTRTHTLSLSLRLVVCISATGK